jgi:RNA polymerase sigma-70 factor (ECF subfamily)
MSRSDHTVHRRTNKSTIYHLMRPSAPDSNPTAGWRDTVTGSWRLVEAAKAGDVQAFGRLYDRYNSEVYKYLWLRCGHIQLAQDLTSDVWERALRNIGRLRFQGGSPIAWLLTIARNRAIDHFRSGRYRLEVLDAALERGDQPDWSVDVEQAVVSRAEAATLLSAVKLLSPAQQEAIALTYFCGLDNSAAAEVMGNTPNAVKALTMRGRRRLIHLLERLEA